MDNDVSGIIGLIVGLVFVLIGLGLFLFALWVWVRIVGRTGHNQWLGLLMVVPIANLVLMLILAFAEWPIHREIETLRRQLAEARSSS